MLFCVLTLVCFGCHQTVASDQRTESGNGRVETKRKQIMNERDEAILIIDETRFSRICGAILEMMGYGAETVSDNNNFCPGAIANKHKLVITSYPYCLDIYNDIKKLHIPVIILSDYINNELISLLQDKNNTYCLMKPLDYQEFKCLVSHTMGSYCNAGGYDSV